jgi:hypothetical protein
MAGLGVTGEKRRLLYELKPKMVELLLTEAKMVEAKDLMERR